MSDQARPKLFLIDAFEGRNPTTVRLFQQAATQAGIECEVLYADSFDITSDVDITDKDLLYGISVEPQAKALFTYLAATKNPVTVFKDRLSLVTAGENVFQATLLLEAAGLPVNKTVYTLTNVRELLDRYVEYLGGYPVIIKAVGGSHGVGVMRFDSAPSLYAGADFLMKSGGRYIMRQFVEHDSHARLIVLGDRVVDSISYVKTTDDFRTNASESPSVQPATFSPEIERIAVEATAAIGSDFGGVDIMIDRAGEPHIAEVNVPCFFARAQLASGTDIARQIIEFLQAKSRGHDG